MEYSRKICVELEDFNNLLASGHDSTMYLNFSLFFTSLLGFSFLAIVHQFLALQKENDGLLQVKKSLMDHIVTLEAELTDAYANEEQEQEQEKEQEQEQEKEQEHEQEQEQEKEQEHEQEREELDDLADDTKPHAD
jgi:spore cortex formation protein SpoVR/YcgB (stage V sporulation)